MDRTGAAAKVRGTKQVICYAVKPYNKHGYGIRTVGSGRGKMRNAQKQEVLGCIDSLHQAHEEIKEALKK